ncbi:MAG: hypothetical protein NTX91_02820 [candidate division SR1 bacterium]|nr:hypothetical protein [candidate division SR1 bacterium]
MIDIVAAYDRNINLYEDFNKELIKYIRNLLDGKIKTHSITGRCKEKNSFMGKISKTPDKYKSLSDMTDLSGIRITALFESDVDKISSILSRNLIVDHDNSIDKRTLIDADRFGYASLHLIVSLPENYDKTKYLKFSGMKAEIQIRSILQHARAEIEHGLGYKNNLNVPYEMRRRFSRIASLLEIADEEFDKIKQDLQTYSLDIDKHIKDNSKSTPLNFISLKALIKGNPLIKKVDKDISNYFGGDVNYNDIVVMNREIERFKFFGINKIKILLGLLKENERGIINMAKCLLPIKKKNRTPAGISLYYLGYVLAAKKGSIDYIIDYIDKTGIVVRDSSIEERRIFANKILHAYKSL